MKDPQLLNSNCIPDIAEDLMKLKKIKTFSNSLVSENSLINEFTSVYNIDLS